MMIITFFKNLSILLSINLENYFVSLSVLKSNITGYQINKKKIIDVPHKRSKDNVLPTKHNSLR